MRALTFEELFEPQFLHSLDLFRVRARRVARGGRYAEHASQSAGAGLEFKDFRPYEPGDDLRAVDWNIYRRLGKVFIKVFEEQQDLPLYLMPDVSPSMFLESPPRAKAALRAALALGAVSLHQHDSVSLFPFAEDLQIKVKGKAGKAAVMSLARHLAMLERRQGTELSRALKVLSGMKLRPGLLVILSDFFDPAGLDPVITALKSTRHRLLLVQLTRASDAAPDLRGDLRLRDCETGEFADVSVTPQILSRYRAAYTRFNEQLAGFARSRGAGLVQLDADGDVVTQLATLFHSGSMLV